ncbi:MAG TPA: RDD family protein [Candidatus Krumholzibacteriaceae bacterium]|jgi:uncharacterized RDD family membrane protein YckC|nr:RDD family protein [Candidatus Krumholzibacteriaceae bacterium]
MSSELETGYSKIFHSPKLQDYWIRRLIAFIIDAVIVSVAVLILELIIFWAVSVSTSATFMLPWWSTNSLVFPFSSGLPLFLYSACTESIYGFTIGKRIMHLKVITKEGNKPTLNKALLRNVTKIYWLAILLDIVVSLAMPNRDPTHRYLDSYAGTTVVSENWTLLKT